VYVRRRRTTTTVLACILQSARERSAAEAAAGGCAFEATADELISTIHGHPTVSEAVREAVLAAEKRAIHMPNRK